MNNRMSGVQRYEFVSTELNGKTGKPKSAKFWYGKVEGTVVVVQFGRIGTEGMVKEKVFDSIDDAVTHLEKKTQEKLKKGYAPVQ